MHVNGIHFTLQFRMCAEVMCDSARTRTDLQQPDGLRTLGQPKQALDFQAFQPARGQIGHGVRLAGRIHAIDASWDHTASPKLLHSNSAAKARTRSFPGGFRKISITAAANAGASPAQTKRPETVSFTASVTP